MTIQACRPIAHADLRIARAHKHRQTHSTLESLDEKDRHSVVPKVFAGRATTLPCIRRTPARLTPSLSIAIDPSCHRCIVFRHTTAQAADRLVPSVGRAAQLLRGLLLTGRVEC